MFTHSQWFMISQFKITITAFSTNIFIFNRNQYRFDALLNNLHVFCLEMVYLITDQPIPQSL